jgi:hypothetical protein
MYGIVPITLGRNLNKGGVMSKTGRGKDIAGHMIFLLRQNDGILECTGRTLAKLLSCHQTTVSSVIRGFLSCGIITSVETHYNYIQGVKGPKRFKLNSAYRKGDSWRETYNKRRSLTMRASASPAVHTTPTAEDVVVNTTILGLSKELVELYKFVPKYEELVRQNAELAAKCASLQMENESIKADAKSIDDQSRQQQEELMSVQSELMELRSGNSKSIRFDKCGVQVTT